MQNLTKVHTFALRNDFGFTSVLRCFYLSFTSVQRYNESLECPNFFH